MFKKETSSPDAFDTLIGINSTMEGNIETEGTIRIDGKVNGDVKINGDVYIGKDAIINGNIFASNIFVSGKVEGNVEAKGILRALATAQLYGDIMVHSLITEEGSIFEGKCRMIAVDPNNKNDKGIFKKNKTSKENESERASVVEQIFDQREKETQKAK